MRTSSTFFSLILGLVLFGCASTETMTRSEPMAPAKEATSTDTTATDGAKEPDAPAVTMAPEDWYLLDPAVAPYDGIGADTAYRLLKGRTPQRTVVVAVIDSGVDITHEDLDDVIWTNEDEVPGNGQDDDGNGYVDDVHGWSFIGGPDGENVQFDTFEVTRELARLEPTFGNVDPDSIAAGQQEQYAYYKRVKAAYEERKQTLESNLNNITGAERALVFARQMLSQALGTDAFTAEQVVALEPDTDQLRQARGIYLYLQQLGIDDDDITEQKEMVQHRIDYGLNLDYDPRDVVGDDYADTSQRIYGNNDVTGPDPFHGTHVSGIIAAERNNGIGIDGIASDVKIMVVRAVPDGDERDKDVANAIRYAVDNGANVINMSFGKDFSPQKAAVDAAVRYADEHGVLMVHGAGNDGEDIDLVDSFPDRYYLDGGSVKDWLDVGASSWEDAEHLAASFSNFGARSVDLFAPGVSIYSTVPDQGYDRADGTSMASPVVAGVAALLMAYFPDLTAAQVRDILLHSVTSFSGQEVVRPGTQDEMVDFGSLSSTGGIVNAAKAVEMASKMAGE